MEGNSPSLYATLSILTILSILFCEWSSNQGYCVPGAFGLLGPRFFSTGGDAWVAGSTPKRIGWNH